ncbi:MAG: ribonuclease HII, partial [Gammaproteobacteria bacterium]|nr:ribonuclease HII [Gammaproteobacteria bacterium]
MQSEFEFKLEDQRVIAGVDEVGRGPLAGDVVAAAVILDPAKPIAGLNDSKKLSERQRLACFEQIARQARCLCVARASVEEIDRVNVLQASLIAMERA